MILLVSDELLKVCSHFKVFNLLSLLKSPFNFVVNNILNMKPPAKSIRIQISHCFVISLQLFFLAVTCFEGAACT